MTATTPKTPENIEVDEPVTHEDITMEGRHIEISGTYRVPDRYGQGEEELQQKTVEEWVAIDEGEASPADHDAPSEYGEADAEITTPRSRPRSCLRSTATDRRPRSSTGFGV